MDISTIERFLARVKRGSQARSKDLRLEFSEAVALAAEISLLLARVTQQPMEPAIVAMDGGRLSQPK